MFFLKMFFVQFDCLTNTMVILTIKGDMLTLGRLVQTRCFKATAASVKPHTEFVLRKNISLVNNTLTIKQN